MTSTGGRALLAVAGVFALNSIVAVHAPTDGILTLPATLAETGVVTAAHRGEILERPFTVPPSTNEIDIDFAFEPAGRPVEFDLGLRSPAGVRGWSEDRSDHIHLDAASASFGYLPGPIQAGQWALLIGVANVPDAVEIHYQAKIRLSNELDRPGPVLRAHDGWYAGDLHTHSGHSDGYHTTKEGIRRPVSVAEIQAAALRDHLDFAAITDHNTTSHWLDIDRVQPETRRLLLLHGIEVTTYRGHFNAIGGLRLPDFRLGPNRPMTRVLGDTRADGAFVSINHPWLPNDEWCMGCRWTDSDNQTLAGAQGVEVVNGPLRDDRLPGFHYWADLLNAGHRLVAVGGSDSHDPSATDRPVGRPITLVHASALSEDRVRDGLKQGRVYVRTVGVAGPSIDFEATDGVSTAAMGGSIHSGRVTFRAMIDGAKNQDCVWIKRGQEIQVRRLKSAHVELKFATEAVAGDWFSIVIRNGPHWTALSNAIYIDP